MFLIKTNYPEINNLKNIIWLDKLPVKPIAKDSIERSQINNPITWKMK